LDHLYIHITNSIFIAIITRLITSEVVVVKDSATII